MFAVASLKFDEVNLDDEVKFIHHIGVEFFFARCASFNFHEIFVLKTCNRFEVYCREEELYSILRQMSGSSKKAIAWIQRAKILFGVDAIRHLFCVTSGIDSRLLGDYEISGQVRDAANLSKKFNCLGGKLESLVNAALAASKEVKTRTSICKGMVSYASVAAHAAMLHFGSLCNKKIVVYGTGQIGSNLVKCLLRYTDGRNIILVNRTLQKAIDVAQKHNLNYAEEADLATVLSDANLLFTTTAADSVLVENGLLINSKVAWIADLAQPSNVSPDVKKLGVQLLDLNMLTTLFEQNMSDRKHDLPKAIGIVEKQIDEYKKRERLNQYLAHALAWINMKDESVFYNIGDVRVADSAEKFVQRFMTQMNPMVKQRQDSACVFLTVMNGLEASQNLN
jgi:glutamyl-tRNA reductase